jgi:hypothetical protein
MRRQNTSVERNVSNIWDAFLKKPDCITFSVSAVSTEKYTTWPESSSELYRSSDRLLSAKLTPTFAYRVSRGQRDGSPRPNSRLSTPEPLLFLPSSSSTVFTRLGGPRSGCAGN